MKLAETMGRFEAPKPVDVGDILNVQIESENGQGEGIAKIDDFVIFIKGVGKGENCKIKIKEVKRTYAIGEKL